MIDPNTVTKTSLLCSWQSAIADGTFLTAKHDLANAGSGCPSYRTVSLLSQPKLGQYLGSGNYDLRLYENTQQPRSPIYIEVVPQDPGFVAGSGIQPSSPIPTTSCNRFVVVSGVNQGWHLFAEQDIQISLKQANHQLNYLGDIL